jgi:LPPG:FO 2-phospho-L-lactate transferase
VTVTVLAGGVGAARFLRGLRAAVDPATITAIVNVADDEVVNGLYVSPDIDTIVYTCAGAIDPERGWGLEGETWRAMEELRRLGAAAGRPDLGWFNLGDRDIGTHMFRTARLAEGSTLTEVTAELASGWELGMSVLPVTDDRVATRVATADLGELAFQEYFVREQHGIEVTGVRFAGADTTKPGPAVLDALASSDCTVIAPSNPIVSIGPLLAVPGVRDAVVARRDRTVAISPIVGGKALKGPADRLLVELGHESSVVGVARLYRDVASVLVVDSVDEALAPAVEAEGMRCVVTPTVMSDPEVAADLARTTIGAVT